MPKSSLSIAAEFLKKELGEHGLGPSPKMIANLSKLLDHHVVKERKAIIRIVNDTAPSDPSDSRFRGADEAVRRILGAIRSRS